MAFDLPAMVRRNRTTRRRSITVPAQEPTQALENDLAAIYVSVVRAWQEAARNRILPVYEFDLAHRRHADGLTRDDARRIGVEIEAAEGTVSRIVLTITAQLSEWVLRVERWSRGKWVGAVKSATGLDVSPMVAGEEASDVLQASLARNIGLIRSVSEETRKRIEEAVWQGYQARQPRRQLAKAINEATGLARDRSLRIAADQTTKLAAALDEERQKQAGITSFKWRHSAKLHYRPHHKARDGKVYPWKGNGLNGDLPGRAPFCGCKAQAHIEL